MKGRRVCLGVTGCIAAYKAAELASAMVQKEAEVTVVMTESATHLVGPATFEALTGRPVYTEMWQSHSPSAMQHIAVADWAEVVLVAPATANILGKVASGIADDLLSTILMTVDVPVMFAPAMNTRMWKNPIVQANVARLREVGYRFVDPEEGFLACGTFGMGRLADPKRILAALVELLAATPPKAG
jgi:phosphopantothenoylcysteine decarboxylase/phosphopantothenate--cysteine ligase